MANNLFSRRWCCDDASACTTTFETWAPCFLILVAARALNNIKSWSVFNAVIGSADHLAADHYLSKSISAEVERSCESHSIMGIVSVVVA